MPTNFWAYTIKSKQTGEFISFGYIQYENPSEDLLAHRNSLKYYLNMNEGGEVASLEFVGAQLPMRLKFYVPVKEDK